MRRRCFSSLLFICLFVISINLYADVAVEVGVFYDSLAPYGDWIYLSEYGLWVWRPVGLWYGWQPYTYGRWEWSEEYGWIWISNFEWGWAPFHYGRWFFHNEFGWVWVPGTIWRPHWVVWYYSGHYVGWYPYCPSFIVIDYWSPVVYERVIIVDSGNITSGKYKHNAIPKDIKSQMFGTTSGTHQYIPDENDSNYYNYGPPKTEIEKISGQRFTPVKTEFSNMPANRFDGSNHRLQIFKPDFKNRIGDLGMLTGGLNNSMSPQKKILPERHTPLNIDDRFRPKYNLPLGNLGTDKGNYNSEKFYYKDKSLSPKGTLEYRGGDYNYGQNNRSSGKYDLRNEAVKSYRHVPNKNVFSPGGSDDEGDDSSVKKGIPKFTPKGGTLPKSIPSHKGQ